MCDSLSQSRWAAGNFHWVPDSPVSAKTCVVLSPPVCQLTHVSNRLWCSMLLSQVHLVLLCCSFLAHPSGFAHFSDSKPYSLLFTRHLLESFQLYTCLPSCHLLLGGSLEPRSAIPLRSAHPELHLLPSNLLQLHLQLLPHPLPAMTQSTSLVPHPSPC